MCYIVLVLFVKFVLQALDASVGCLLHHLNSPRPLLCYTFSSPCWMRRLELMTALQHCETCVTVKTYILFYYINNIKIPSKNNMFFNICENCQLPSCQADFLCPSGWPNEMMLWPTAATVPGVRLRVEPESVD